MITIFPFYKHCILFVWIFKKLFIPCGVFCLGSILYIVVRAKFILHITELFEKPLIGLCERSYIMFWCPWCLENINIACTNTQLLCCVYLRSQYERAVCTIQNANKIVLILTLPKISFSFTMLSLLVWIFTFTYAYNFSAIFANFKFFLLKRDCCGKFVTFDSLNYIISELDHKSDRFFEKSDPVKKIVRLHNTGIIQ